MAEQVVDLRRMLFAAGDRLYRPTCLLLRGGDRPRRNMASVTSRSPASLRVPDVAYRATARRTLRSVERIGFAVSIGVCRSPTCPLATVSGFRGVRGLSPGSASGSRAITPVRSRSSTRRFPPGVRRRHLHSGNGRPRCHLGRSPGLEHRLLGVAGHTADGRTGVPVAGRLVVPEQTPPDASRFDPPSTSAPAERTKPRRNAACSRSTCSASRQVWAITIARFLEEPAFWIWIFWLPKYVQDRRTSPASRPAGC